MEGNEDVKQDILLFFVQKGAGENLLLLHGNGESHEYFEHQIDVFAKYFNVIAIDTRGHGDSARGRAPFTLAQFVEDLHCFMQNQHIVKSHILGFSDGGNIALLFTLKYPQMVDKLILCGANISPCGIKEWYQIPIVIMYYFGKLRKNRSVKSEREVELLGLMVKEPHIKIEQLQQIENEVLIITGRRDVVKRSHSRKIRTNIFNSRWIEIEGNHFVARNNFSEFNRDVVEFLQ